MVVDGSSHVPLLGGGKPECRDPIVAGFFYLQLVAVIVTGAVLYPEYEDNDDVSLRRRLTGAGNAATCEILAGMLVFAAVASAFFFRFIIAFPERVIYFAYLAGVAVLAVVAAFLAYCGVSTGDASYYFLAAILSFFALLKLVILSGLGDRIAFSAAMLHVACRAVDSHRALFCVVLGKVLVLVAWCVAWFVALDGVVFVFTRAGETSSAGYAAAVIALVFSFFWTANTINYVLKATTAGAVASWWFAAHDAWSVTHALARACGSSFGSIASAACIVAVLETLEIICSVGKKDRGPNGCEKRVNELVQYYNRWALTYVGVYGDDIMQASKDVYELFHRVGFTAVVNDMLIDGAFGIGSFVVGVATCVLGVIIGAVYESTEDIEIFAIFGFFAGAVICHLATSVINQAVATVFVAFAEDPGALKQNDAQAYAELHDTWVKFYPDQAKEIAAHESHAPEAMHSRLKKAMSGSGAGTMSVMTSPLEVPAAAPVAAPVVTEAPTPAP